MKKQRKSYTAAFKAKVALEAIKGQRTTNEIASAYEVHPNQVTQWKKQAVSQLSKIFSNGRARADAAEEDLRNQVGEDDRHPHETEKDAPGRPPPQALAGQGEVGDHRHHERGGGEEDRGQARGDVLLGPVHQRVRHRHVTDAQKGPQGEKLARMGGALRARFRTRFNVATAMPARINTIPNVFFSMTNIHRSNG